VAEAKDGTDPEREARIEALRAAARQRPARELVAFLEQACGGDTSLRREVEARLVRPDPSGGVTAQLEGARADDGLAAFDIPPGGRVGPYRVVRVIGRGSMGTVYLAERADGPFPRPVALKLVLRGQDSELVLRFFREEQPSLANLDHPNIARLLDGGATAEGLPYLAAEHVEGERIDEHCERRALDTAARLRLFRTVCAAVQYAHQNLVVHRDLKPGNILVTAEGVPRLLDTGIAKILRPRLGSTQTQTRARALTPYYASPEQFRGEAITTATDVYSLGVVLYELLTGRKPYEFTSLLPLEIARVVCEQDPSPLSALASPGRRELRGDLDAILLRALRKEPARRYASVEQFSEDLRRHLEDLPVLARNGTLGYRAGKFVRRHRGGVAAALLVLLGLFAGIAATARQAQVARAQRARAEQRFADVRRLAHSLFFDTHDEIRDLPGATHARETLVTRGLEYLDGVAQEAAGDDSLQQELAEAYVRVGDVQGRPGSSNPGDRTGALASYAKARDLREALAARHPGPEAERDLAAVLDRMGDTQRDRGDTRSALQSYGRALALREKQGGRTREIATSRQRIADLQAAMGEAASALESQRSALAVFEELAARAPAEAAAQREVFVGQVKMGDRLAASGDLEGALESYRRALSSSEAMASRDAKSVRALRELAVCHDKVGDTLAALGQPSEALQRYGAALAIRQDLAAADPGDAELARDLSVSHEKLGRFHLSRGDGARAVASFRQALALDEAAVRADPSSAQARLDLSSDLESLGWALLAGGRLDESEACLRRALETRERVAAEDPASSEVRGGFVSLYATLGRAAAARAASARGARAGRFCQQARDWHDKALLIEQEGLPLPPGAEPALKVLAGQLVRCGA
jgi:non-specific serine/threonine protein kinase/serine/threonine-protein kinase